MTFGAVLDANVLVPAALRDTLLRAAERGLYRPRWNRAILGELHRALVREGLAQDEAAGRLVAAMRRAFPDASVEEYERLIPDLANDPGDRHVLAAAITGDATTIVTSNLRHFPLPTLAPFGIVALSPDQFLMDLLARYQVEMQHVVREQAGDLRQPPKSLAEVLDTLAINVPGFVSAIRGARNDG